MREISRIKTVRGLLKWDSAAGCLRSTTADDEESSASSDFAGGASEMDNVLELRRAALALAGHCHFAFHEACGEALLDCFYIRYGDEGFSSL